MKCIRSTKLNDQGQTTIRRVKEDEAERKVKTGEWKYTTKEAWKKAGRPTK